MKLRELKRIIAEEAKKLEEKRHVSDELNRLVGFADVFANLPRRIRLDVLRVVEGEHGKVDPANVSQALDVLHGLDPALDAALEEYVDSYSESGATDEQTMPAAEMREDAADGVGELDEVAPPGFEKVVKALKKSKSVKNPYAVAWSEKNKGYKTHGKK